MSPDPFLVCNQTGMDAWGIWVFVKVAGCWMLDAGCWILVTRCDRWCRLVSHTQIKKEGGKIPGGLWK